MLELLIRLEYKRQACRRRALGRFSQHGDSYFGVALIVLLATVPPTALVPLVPLGSTLVLLVLAVWGPSASINNSWGTIRASVIIGFNPPLGHSHTSPVKTSFGLVSPPRSAHAMTVVLYSAS